jgi:DNA invertase Pin-like site-specific DNA recombinase
LLCAGVRRAQKRCQGPAERPQFAQLFEEAYRRRFDILLCWALDRFSREGVLPAIGILRRLAAASVSFHSYTEPMPSTDYELIRNIVLAVMASLAKHRSGCAMSSALVSY